MIKYVVKFGSYYQEVLTPGMAKILADELISQNFEGCRDEGKTAQDLISLKERKESN
jgi:hypothetical protein